MDLYFYTKRKDIAATSLADLALLITALESSTVSEESRARVVSRVFNKVESLVQSDGGEQFNLYFYDSATTPAAWSTSSAVTLTMGLGRKDARNAYAFSSTTSFSISGYARRGTLALNGSDLTEAIEEAASLTERTIEGITLFLHVRKTSAAGVSETVAMMPIFVEAGVIDESAINNTDMSGVSNAQFLTGAIHPWPSITSLTGGGATALDGQETAGDELPTGYTILLSLSTPDGRQGTTWQLLEGTDAEDVAAGVVRPDDYDGTTNARVWYQL